MSSILQPHPKVHMHGPALFTSLCTVLDLGIIHQTDPKMAQFHEQLLKYCKHLSCKTMQYVVLWGPEIASGDLWCPGIEQMITDGVLLTRSIPTHQDLWALSFHLRSPGVAIVTVLDWDMLGSGPSSCKLTSQHGESSHAQCARNHSN